MLDVEKRSHYWSCDVSRGDVQCPYISRYHGGFWNCVWRENHPDSLPHETYWNQPNGPDKLTWELSEVKDGRSQTRTSTTVGID